MRPEKNDDKRKRGQQLGSSGHGRRDFSHLETIEEEVSLLEENALCHCCHLTYEELPDTEDSDVLEIINVYDVISAYSLSQNH